MSLNPNSSQILTPAGHLAIVRRAPFWSQTLITDLLTVDGQGSGLDADMIRGRSIDFTGEAEGSTIVRVSGNWVMRPRQGVGYANTRFYLNDIAGTTPTGNSTQSTLQLVALTFQCDSDWTPNRIGVTVSVAGAAGKIARLGIYRPGTAGVPGALHYDAGTVAVDSTGDKEATMTGVTLYGGTTYWLVITTDGAANFAGTGRFGNRVSNNVIGQSVNANAGNQVSSASNNNNPVNPLASTFPAAGLTAITYPNLWLRKV